MIVTRTIELQTDPPSEENHVALVDITPQVAHEVAGAGIESGTVTVFVAGSTAGLTTIEYEPGLISDFQDMWAHSVPENINYNHDRRWGDGNGYSHIRASLLGASLVIPFSNKKLLLGTWQQVVLADFDNRPRSRQVILQIMGD